jgi:SNF2 family DNA or RNA helicase
MGTGKTLTTIALLTALVDACSQATPSDGLGKLASSKFVVVCTKGVIDHWMAEFEHWTPVDSHGKGNAGSSAPGALGMIHASPSSETTNTLASVRSIVESWKARGGVLVISTSQLDNVQKNGPEIAQVVYDEAALVVLDEAHLIGTKQSITYINLSKFSTRFRLVLTGTLMTNGLEQLYYVISWVFSGKCMPWVDFSEKFNAVERGNFSNGTISPEDYRLATKRLNSVLGGFIHLYEHSSGLPEKQEFLIDIFLTPEQVQYYDAFLEANERGSDPSGSNKENQVPVQAKGSNHFAMLCTLQLLLAHPSLFIEHVKTNPRLNLSALRSRMGNPEVEKMKSHRIDVMMSILDNSRAVGDKVLVFSHRLPVLHYILRLLKDGGRSCYIIDGTTASKQRVVDEFTNDHEPAVLLLSTTAGGVGLNIQAANRVIIFDFAYTPTAEQQAIAKAYRFGQTKPVVVYWFMSSGTFEVSVQNYAIFKTQLSLSVVKGKQVKPQAQRNVQAFSRQQRQQDSVRGRRDQGSRRGRPIGRTWPSGSRSYIG